MTNQFENYSIVVGTGKHFHKLLQELISAEEAGVKELIGVAETLPRTRERGWQIGMFGSLHKILCGTGDFVRFHIMAVSASGACARKFGGASIEVLFCQFMTHVSRECINDEDKNRLRTAWEAVGGFVL